MSTTEIVRSISVENMVNQRAAVIERLQQATRLVREAATIAGAGGLGMPRISISTGWSRGGYERSLADCYTGARPGGYQVHREADPDEEVQKIIRHGVDAAAWQHLMSESGLRSLMDATARERWDSGIQKGEFPELTRANIEATFAQLHGARGEMFERGVIACFKALAWDYKTNLPQKFGKRIVIRYLTSSHRGADELDDLVRVFHVLDGQPEPDHRHGVYSMLCDAGLRHGKAGECKSEYLRIKAFQNCNGHVEFLRLDIVEKMNQIIAKHYPGALPAPK